jgi:hypothetical protein
MTINEAEQWRPFRSCCPACDGTAEVLTKSGEDNAASDGDPARCVNCGHTGSIGSANVLGLGVGFIVWAEVDSFVEEMR